MKLHDSSGQDQTQIKCATVGETRSAMTRRWRATIHLGSIWNDPDLTDAQRALSVSRRLRKSSWYAESHDARNVIDELVLFAENMKDEPEREDDLLAQWNYFWYQMYDAADYDRIWIDVWGQK